MRVTWRVEWITWTSLFGSSRRPCSEERSGSSVSGGNATGAAAFVTLSVLTPGESSPTRIAAQVVSGIGFLGAGVIIREGLNIKGINTAATLWCSAAVGALTGSGFFALAAIMTGVVVLTNTALRPLGPLIERHHASGTEVEVSYQLTATCRSRTSSMRARCSCRPLRWPRSCCDRCTARMSTGLTTFAFRHS